MPAQKLFSERVISDNGYPVAGQPPIAIFDGRAQTVGVFHKSGGWFKAIFDNHSLSICSCNENEIPSELRSRYRPPQASAPLYFLHARGLGGYPDEFEWLEDEEEALAVLAVIQKAKSA
jgi:hypothetical protein